MGLSLVFYSAINIDIFAYKGSFPLCRAQEHEPVFRLLMESGMTVDDDLRDEALLIAEQDGSDSMSRLIRLYESDKLPLKRIICDLLCII
jgi:hypothetical protein